MAAKKSISPRPYQVFVSHATADKWIAKTICEKIEERGATTFRDDRDIQGGDSIPDEIRDQLRRSHEVAVLLTPASFDRPWVLLEVGAAWVLKPDKRIVPIRYHIEVDRVPEMLKDRKSIALNDFDRYLAELQDRVGGHHGKRRQGV